MKKKSLLLTVFNRSILTIMVIFFTSCAKQDDWLDAKRDRSDVTPKTLQDFQAILDNNQVMNGYSAVIGLVGSDNAYVPDSYLDATDQVARNAYLWNQDIYQSALASDWLYPYQVVEYANIVLDGISDLNPTATGGDFDNIKGAALFFRAFAFYELAQLYCKAFDPGTAASDKGIVIRLTSDVNQKVGRTTVQATYDQIIGDLKMSASLLPKTPKFKTRPSSVAAKALLARIYLSMGNYTDALAYADQTLKDNSALLDFSTLSTSTSNPFPSLAKGNPEVIFHAWGIGNNLASVNGRNRIDPLIYQSYETGDLRRTVFYVADGSTGLYRFKGTYSANAYYFCGLALNEIYLIRAECLARKGKIQDALTDLNSLLQNRFTKNSFVPVQISDPTLLLKRLILERRKEMPFTAQIRWDDLRRLNRSSETAIILNRVYRGVAYSIQPDNPKYVLPLPQDEIQLNNLEQNIR